MAGKPNQETVDEIPRDAASVVLVREANGQGLEAFLLKRSGSSTVLGNAYVFPGGKLDPEDAEPERFSALGVPGDPVQMLGEPALNHAGAGALFVAACRETLEETGVTVDGAKLLPLSRWITPKTPAMMRRRFDTRFFVGLMPAGQTALHDGQEASESVWMGPHDALSAYICGEMNLAPPQLMTLAGLARHESFASLADSLRGKKPPLIEPFSYREGEDGRVITYPGNPRHPVSERAMVGPTSLVWRDGRFVPADGLAGFFVDS